MHKKWIVGAVLLLVILLVLYAGSTDAKEKSFVNINYDI